MYTICIVSFLFVCFLLLLFKSSHTLWWQKASITDCKSSQLEVTGAAGASENLLMTFYFYFTLLERVHDLIGNIII